MIELLLVKVQFRVHFKDFACPTNFHFYFGRHECFHINSYLEFVDYVAAGIYKRKKFCHTFCHLQDLNSHPALVLSSGPVLYWFVWFVFSDFIKPQFVRFECVFCYCFCCCCCCCCGQPSVVQTEYATANSTELYSVTGRIYLERGIF